MKKHTIFLTVTIILFQISFAACSSKPSDSVIQTAIAQTKVAEPGSNAILPSSTPFPILTATPLAFNTLTPTPLATIVPTIAITQTRTQTPGSAIATQVPGKASPSPTITQTPIVDKLQTQKIGPIWSLTRDESFTSEISLKKIEWSMGDKYDQPKPGNIYVIVYLQVKNLGPNPSRYVGLNQFKVLDSNGRLIDDSYMSDISNCKFEIVDLIANGIAEGCFLFQVPISGKVELIYAPYQYDGLKTGRYLSFIIRK